MTLDGTKQLAHIDWQVTDANSDGAAGSPTYGAQLATAATSHHDRQRQRDIRRSTDITGNATHIPYIEGGAAATLEGILTVHDDLGGTSRSQVRSCA